MPGWTPAAKRTPTAAAVPSTRAGQPPSGSGPLAADSGARARRWRGHDFGQVRVHADQRAAPPVRAAPRLVDDVLAAPGRPLDSGIRGEEERRFGHDFGAVRLHTDAAAAASAEAVQAAAYTVGQRIVFAAGRFDPGSPSGRQLLAHELAHTVQQAAGAPAGPLELSGPQDRSETEAHSVATAAVQGRPVTVTARRQPHLARQDPTPPAPILTPAAPVPVEPVAPAAADLAVEPTPTATVILVGSPTHPDNEHDISPYNFSNAAVMAVPKIRAAVPGTQATILYFSTGFRLRNAHEEALEALQGTGATVIEVTSTAEVVSFLSTGLVAADDTTPTRAVKISRFFYFGHAGPSSLDLNWGWDVQARSQELKKADVLKIKAEAFTPAGESYLFTCHVAQGEQSFMAVWASHLGQTAIGPQGLAAFDAKYDPEDLERAINQRLPKWFLGLPYMNQVRIIDAPPPPAQP
jgi:Domain of unknown function (DUF4157)